MCNDHSPAWIRSLLDVCGRDNIKILFLKPTRPISHSTPYISQRGEFRNSGVWGIPKVKEKNTGALPVVKTTTWIHSVPSGLSWATYTEDHSWFRCAFWNWAHVCPWDLLCFSLLIPLTPSDSSPYKTKVWQSSTLSWMWYLILH